VISNPKRRAKPSLAPLWYDYYAGYSESFVTDALGRLGFSSDSIVLDPWNGTGTTTAVATLQGFQTWGFDLNPALVLVGKARLLSANVAPSLNPLADELVARLPGSCPPPSEVEPLRFWFDRTTAASFRQIERSIQTLLLPSSAAYPLYSARTLAEVSSLAALYYVALFQTVRAFLGPFLTTNATWIKEAPSETDLVQVSRSNIVAEFKARVKSLGAYLRSRDRSDIADLGSVDRAHATELPLASEVVDGIITSPPYCTRIDYVIATWPELAVLGAPDKDALKTLRNEMTGTPTINSVDLSGGPGWGDTCEKLLSAVERHPSKASASYYHRFYLQYFSGLFSSLLELTRVAKTNARSAIVVQDSFYKDLHVDLPRILVEMAEGLGWSEETTIAFEVRQSMTHINPGRRVYGKAAKVTEAVVVLER
jgi:hypothetical protein